MNPVTNNLKSHMLQIEGDPVKMVNRVKYSITTSGYIKIQLPFKVNEQVSTTINDFKLIS